MSIIDWFKESNRWKHLLGGVAVGAGSDDWYCAIYAGAGIGAAMEFKDYQWGGKPDWIDAALTLAGSLVGYGIRYGIFSIF